MVHSVLLLAPFAPPWYFSVLNKMFGLSLFRLVWLGFSLIRSGCLSLNKMGFSRLNVRQWLIGNVMIDDKLGYFLLVEETVLVGRLFWVNCCRFVDG